MLGPDIWAETDITVGRRRFRRIIIRTPWLDAGTDLKAELRRHLEGIARVGDLVIVSEKVAIVTAGRTVPAAAVTPGPLARFLAERVRPIGGSRGLSIPEKMQYVIEDAGKLRILLATLTAALTRPLGIKGAFYLIGGRVARSLDGMRPPYDDVLLPPLHPSEARALASELARSIRLDVAIVDMNDRGGSIRAISGGTLSARILSQILADNPLGQRDQSTPFGLVREL